MGFFDRFKKKDQPEPEPNLPAEPVFQPAGPYEMALCRGTDALNQLSKLRKEGRAAGFEVILLGGEEDARSLREIQESTTPEEYLRLAANVNVESWLKEKADEFQEQMSEVMGEWPSGPPQKGSILAHLDILTMKPKKIACLAKVPTSQNWQVPAYIGMGGWNDCPDAAVITAFAKRWHERYGAEVTSITRDVMEFTVAKPPATREAAMELAREQYLFCYDIVEQGVGDISALGATLLNSDYWYFWWD
jgi:hypothetical protein